MGDDVVSLKLKLINTSECLFLHFKDRSLRSRWQEKLAWGIHRQKERVGTIENMSRRRESKK